MSHDRPAAEGVRPAHFPGPPVAAGHVAPCPRRVRAWLDGRWVVDTEEAYYVWEQPYYPQYAVLRHGLPDVVLAGCRSVPEGSGLADHVVVPFEVAERWFEEDEEVHGHPRSPYVRVDAVRSRRTVRVLADLGSGPVELASSPDCVVVFETGLPPRYYLDPTAVDWSRLVPSATVTHCPYKGSTSGWWSAGDLVDVAWSYAAPMLATQPIAGLVCFDDSQVEVLVDTPAGGGGSGRADLP